MFCTDAVGAAIIISHQLAFAALIAVIEVSWETVYRYLYVNQKKTG